MVYEMIKQRNKPVLASRIPINAKNGFTDKGSKVRQRVKRQKIKMIKIFFDLNHRKLAILITKIRQTFFENLKL